MTFYAKLVVMVKQFVNLINIYILSLLSCYVINIVYNSDWHIWNNRNRLTKRIDYYENSLWWILADGFICKLILNNCQLHFS